jgi:hypothetical protein
MKTNKRSENQWDQTAVNGLHGPSSRPGSTDNEQVPASFKQWQSKATEDISGFIGPFFLRKGKLFVTAQTPRSWHSRAPDANPTDLIFYGTSAPAPLQK